MIIYVVEHKGIYEPLVDSKPETGEIYIPYWKTKDVLNAVNEGEKRGYTAHAKPAYVCYATYAELKNRLAHLLTDVKDIYDQMVSLNGVGGLEMRLDEFMAVNSATLQHAGNSWLAPNGNEGECILLSLDEAKEAIAKWDAEHNPDAVFDAILSQPEFDIDEEDDDEFEEDDYISF